MANKIFIVNRHEDEDTSTAGPATLHRADTPPVLLMADPDPDTGYPDVPNPEENKLYGTWEADREILLVTDLVQMGDLNPVTSEAVFKAINELRQELINKGVL